MPYPVLSSSKPFREYALLLLLTCGMCPVPVSAQLTNQLNASDVGAPYPDPSRVLVVYKSNSADVDHDGVGDSQQLALYYAAKRNVPATNLLGLQISVSSYYYYVNQYDQFYTDMVLPIKNKLESLGPENIDIILLAGDLPTIVYDGINQIRSVDSSLMGLNLLTSASTSAITMSLNPYQAGPPLFSPDKGHFSHNAYKYNNTEIYLVTRLGSDSSLRGITQVDQGLYAERYLYPSPGYYYGNAYVDSQWGIPTSPGAATRYTDAYLGAQTAVQSGAYWTTFAAIDMNIAYSEHYFAAAGFPLKWENSTATARIGDSGASFDDGSTALSAPRALFYGGWYNFDHYNDVYEWLPGSVAIDLNSASFFGTQALKHGATAASYVIAEPGGGGHQRPSILHYYILNGYSFAEASALATPFMGFVGINEGDPLYAPMKVKTPLVDTAAPVLMAGYPQERPASLTGTGTIVCLIDDSQGPKVVVARVDYGTDTGYGSVAESVGGFSRLAQVSIPWIAGQNNHYRITLTDPVGNTTTTQDYLHMSGPSITSPVTANPNPAAGSTTTVAVLGIDPAGEGTLTYTWSATGPTAVTFDTNGNNAAKSTVARFTRAGSYTIQAVVKDAAGLSISSAVTVKVVQVASAIRLTPPAAIVSVGSTEQFGAAIVDQFGNALSPQVVPTWSVTGGGTISSLGLFAAGDMAGGPFNVSASFGTIQAAATVTVWAPATLRTTFLLHGAPSELAGTTNSSMVTPGVGPNGVLRITGSGSVNFVSTQAGSGVYFLNCCTNVNNANYQFSGIQLGSVFDTGQGEIDFAATSRENWSQRQTSSYRSVFDVQDVLGQHLFRFSVISASGRLAFVYGLGSGAVDYYYVPVGQEDAVFGTGITQSIRLLWSGGKRYLYLNGVLKKTTNYTAVAPVWSSSSTFRLGARQYFTFGAYNSDDDLISEFSVSRP